MKKLTNNLMLMFAVAFLAGVAYITFAQDAILSEEPSEDVRFEFLPHNYSAGGLGQEIFLKLDTFTGQTWRFHASNPRWSPIPEPKGGFPRPAGTIVRYELFNHDYMDRNGDEQQLILRVDSVTGSTWQYRGANGAWADIPQDDVPPTATADASDR